MDYITYNDIVAATGIPYGTLRVWATRDKLPKPDTHIGQTAVWLPETIAPWIEANRVAAPV